MKKLNFSNSPVEREIRYNDNIYGASHECTAEEAVAEFTRLTGDEVETFTPPKNGETVYIRDIYRNGDETVRGDWIPVVVCHFAHKGSF